MSACFMTLVHQHVRNNPRLVNVLSDGLGVLCCRHAIRDVLVTVLPLFHHSWMLCLNYRLLSNY